MSAAVSYFFLNKLYHRYLQPPYFGSHWTFGLRSGILKVLLLNIAHCSPLNAKKIRLDSVKQQFIVYKYSSPEIWGARRAFVRRTTPHSYAISCAIFSSVWRRRISAIPVTLFYASPTCSRAFAVTSNFGKELIKNHL